jgi:hypothetical protein
MIMIPEPMMRVKYVRERRVAIWEFTASSRLQVMQSIALDVAMRRTWLSYFDLVRVYAGIRKAQPDCTTVVRRKVKRKEAKRCDS